MAKIVSINVSSKKGVLKNPVSFAEFRKDWGIVGDAHAGKWIKQISILSTDSIEYMNRKYNLKLQPGSFAENITVDGMEVYKLKVGDRLKAGDVLLEISQIGKKCHKGCNIKEITGHCIMPTQGVFAKVISGGRVRKNDEIDISNME